ncbi:PD-(D/E)XK nuclease family protein [Clostridium aminobutyricum]|uniref:Exodeoxyribonuclease V subunit gamma n=1 Tax=Clostridium aminobutyricum TaxID=33953 RepID=A0A939IH23_CLOAM|nr:PD-(D/E)XK nuclease family protein [Clostridium aminobutyricum]MBN7772992.1 exodeoxyribonuclease V subunit gamma [Clostridium aminobutyricum]
MLYIYYGRDNLDKDRFIFDRVTGRTILLVPDQFTLQAERNAFEYLGVKGLMDLEVISPSRLGMRVLREVGGEKTVRIDKYGRHMLLSKIIGQQKESLQVFRGMETRTSFIELVNNLISEMKQFNTSPEELPAILSKLNEDSILYRKLTEVHAIYEKYEESIQGKYVDTEDYLQEYISKIKDSKLVKESECWVYGFDYFTPKNLDLLREIIGTAKDVHVVMTYCEKSRDEEIFALTGDIIRKLERVSQGLAMKYHIAEIPTEYTILTAMKGGEKSPEIAALESELFSIPVQRWRNEWKQEREKDDLSAVTLVQSANMYAEVETAAAFITRLIREKRFRYKDIAVICNDLEVRGSIIKRVFEEHEFPFFMDKKRSILHNPVVGLHLYLLQLAGGKLLPETVIGMAKTGLLDLSADSIEELENYAYRYKIRGGLWKNDFKRGITEYEEERFADINHSREYIFTLIEDFAAPFKKAETAGEKIAVFYYFLKDRLKLQEKLQVLMEEQNRNGYYEVAFETAQIWKIIVELFDQLVTILGEEKLSIHELETILRAGFESVEIGLLPSTIDEMIVGTMQRTRIGKVKALVVIGANDGILPSAASGDGILNDDEKAVLFQHEAEICKLDELRSLEEKLAIYRTLTKPEVYLWMSYSISDNDGKELKPSMIFNKLTQIFPALKLEEDIVSKGDPLALMASKRNSIKHMTAALREGLEGQLLRDEWKAALAWYKAYDSPLAELVQEGIFFKVKEEKLRKEQAELLYKREESSELSISPSRLEKFGRCPFAHFVNYGLRPEEKRVFEIAGREIGDIYHLCLMKLSEHLTKKGVPITDEKSPWMSITPDECAHFVGEFIDKEGAVYQEGLLTGGKEESYKASRLKRVCTDAAQILIEHVQQGHIEEVFFEAEFGKASKKHFPPIEVSIGEEKVFIEGKIDRVDFLPEDYVKIIDYKSGSEKFDAEEAKAGWKLQLMLYLKAATVIQPQALQEEKKTEVIESARKPAGVFYFKLDEPMINASNIERAALTEKVKEEVRKSFKLDGIMVNEPKVIESIAGDFTGSSDIVSIRRNKEGVIVGTGKDKLLSSEEFSELQQSIDVKITQLCAELAEGSVAIKPKKVKEQTACTYCLYRSICHFDLAFEGCSYEVVK